MSGATALHGPIETIFWLVRHPEPEGASQGRCYGSLDLRLSEPGLAQARDIAQRLAAQPFAAIYSSPSRRCTAAAELVAAGRPLAVEPLAALRELDFGEFEGRAYDEIAASHPQFYREWMERPTEVEFPGGESFTRMRARVLGALRGLRVRHAGESVALFTHGGVIRILLADALGMDAANLFRLGQRYGGISRIRYIGDTPVVDVMNL